jgi:hypothetical protein
MCQDVARVGSTHPRGIMDERGPNEPEAQYQRRMANARSGAAQGSRRAHARVEFDPSAAVARLRQHLEDNNDDQP